MGAIRGEVRPMAFAWDLARAPCADAVRAAAGQLRIALRELRGAAGRAPGVSGDADALAAADAAVHEARKALRRARALAELLRPVAGDELAGDLVDAVRGARRRLSAARDGAVLPAALRAAWREREDPADARDGRASAATPAPVRAALLGDPLEPGGGSVVAPEVVAAVAADLEGARHDLKRLHVAAAAAGGGPEPLGPGLRRMHRRARAAARTALAQLADAGAVREDAGPARDDPGDAGGDAGVGRDPAGVDLDAAMHDARKRTKELGYVMRWWAPAWRRPIEAWLLEADTLGDLIGADHDQVVLRSRLPALADVVDAELLAQVLAGSRRRGARLRQKAARALTRLAAEPSGAFVARHLAYMAAAQAWRRRRGGA